MKHSKRSTSLALVALLALAACGGDDASDVLSPDTVSTEAPSETDVPATDPPATDPPPTDPPATDPPATDPPATDPPATDPPTTDANDDVVGDAVAYCAASTDFYVQARALDSIPEADNAAARSLFEQMNVSLAGAIFNAPTEADAAVPQRVEELFETLVPALDSVDYVVVDVSDLPNSDEVFEAFLEFGEIETSLGEFVEANCGQDLVQLEGEAEALAGDVSGATTPPAPPTDDPIDGGSTQAVTDDSGTINVTIPASWTQVDGAPDGELRQLVAAPDTAAFLGGFDQPGIILVAGDAPLGNGDEAGQAGLDGIDSSVLADGCTLTATLPYDDGVYVGNENTYSCPGTDAVTRFAGGTNFAGDLFWLLGVIFEPGNEGIWTTVTETFLVD